jgi:hypothetical protein
VIPLLSLTILPLLASSALGSDVMTSLYSKDSPPLSANPATPFWAAAPSVRAQADQYNHPVPGYEMEVRSRWTKQDLYLLFICHHQAPLHLKPNPTQTDETNELWNWDVAEAFIGDDFKQIEHYKEFEVSPQGEWVDLAINRLPHSTQLGWKWNSGFQVKAEANAGGDVWYGAMRIPFSSISRAAPHDGLELRANFYQAQGKLPDRKQISWQPTYSNTFHVPKAFGRIRLVAEKR